MDQMTQVRVLSTSTLAGDEVRNFNDEKLGKIEDFMLDLQKGCISYAVLSFGGLLGMGEKLFAVPWKALTVDTQNHCFRMDMDKRRLENAPGFDRSDWPEAADQSWLGGVYDYYGVERYW
ncbi:MAG TPA: PRC-barrel domain-containing protein [Coriobacteriia bacterium]|nr:PRC-barrel domain-containing protein [Coriobacteriia bacterium]